MYTEPQNLYEWLNAVQMSSAARRAAVANLQRSEISVDLIIRASDILGRALARLRGISGTEGRHTSCVKPTRA